MTESKKLLFITNAEYGQSSIHLSIIRELLSRDQVEVHLLSFPALKSRVKDLLDSPNGSKFKFHPILSSPSFLEKSEEGGPMTANIRHPTGFLPSLRSYSKMDRVVIPWTTDEYLKIYHEISRILKEIQPDLTMVDVLFLQAIDACQGMKAKYIILTPTPSRYGNNPFSYPAVSSGYDYPLPLLLKPLNYILVFSMIMSFVFGRAWKQVEKSRKENGIQHPFPSFLIPRNVLTITASAPECDFPFTPDPKLTLPVGPMVQPVQSLEAVDPELFQYISKKPTILMALGSHVHTTEKMSLEISKAFKKVLAKRPDIQIIWKVRKPHPSSGDHFNPLENIQKLLGDELEQDQIRIVDWLKADPISILASGHICCFINHGGANCFFEGVYAGVPQVVLACWYDTMENAAKAEYLGIGAFGNRKGAPDAESEEFYQGVLKVIGDGTPRGHEAAKLMKKRVIEVGEASRARGGAQAAADKILEIA